MCQRFASQGYIWNTGDNDYLGGDSSAGTYDFRDYAVNFSMAKGKWRVGAQFYGQKLGPYGDDKMTLDWGSVDYQATQWFGARAGRVKMPRGLYNEALDLDFTRPFVFLPQSVYDARLRDFQASFDGGMIYGNVNLKKAGSLACGDVPNADNPAGANNYHLCDPKVDSLLQQGLASADPATRKQVYDELQQYMYDQALVVPLEPVPAAASAAPPGSRPSARRNAAWSSSKISQRL